jgi:hypothetical protein
MVRLVSTKALSFTGVFILSYKETKRDNQKVMKIEVQTMNIED